MQEVRSLDRGRCCDTPRTARLKGNYAKTSYLIQLNVLMTQSKTDPLAEAYNRGLEFEKAGELHKAAEAYREVLKYDPDDHGGVAVRLAAMGATVPPQKASDAYVATLFDQNADQFDTMLVDDLGYSVPLQLREVLLAQAPGPYERMLDLGCGTGLTGEALSDVTSYQIGVDLSEGMLDIAEEKDVYDGLYVAEVCDFLNDSDEVQFDLIVATDVLPYIGTLDAFFAGLKRMMTPDGLVAFSAETLPEAKFGGADYLVGQYHRFAHHPDYLQRAMAAVGFTSFAFDPIVVRYEQGTPVPGYLVLAKRAAST